MGDSLDTVKRVGCEKLFQAPAASADPGKFQGKMWLKAAVEGPNGKSTATDPSSYICEPVLPFAVGAVKYLPAQKVYLALGTDRNRLVYAISRDLVSWTKPSLLKRFANKGKWREGMDIPTSYFSLLGPTSSTRSFETLESRPYLYYVEYPQVSGGKLDRRGRRLVCVPITIKF